MDFFKLERYPLFWQNAQRLSRQVFTVEARHVTAVAASVFNLQLTLIRQMKIFGLALPDLGLTNSRTPTQKGDTTLLTIPGV